MTDSDTIKPPYVPFGTFKNFADGFRETGLPDVIDRSLMTNLSGTVQSMLASALRSMGFVDLDGKPTDRFRDFIGAEVDPQRAALADGLRTCYRVIFEHGTPVTKMTQGQFDKALRDEFGFTASTLDKAASFFLGAAAEASLEVSQHLQKRKATAVRKRKPTGSDAAPGPSDKRPEEGEPDSPSVPAGGGKPLQYQLIDLMAEPDFAEEHKAAVWSLVQYLATRQTN